MGILGGMSPQATMDFEARVHRAAQRLVPWDRNRGYPRMVVWYYRQLPVHLGEDGLAEITQAAGYPVLSMIDVILDDVVDRGATRVGVLDFGAASPLYLGPLRQRGVHCETIDATAQARLDAAIRAVMEGRDDQADAEAARDAASTLRSRGMQSLVLGCTEIPLLLGDEGEAADLINPAALLAEAAVRFAMERA